MSVDVSPVNYSDSDSEGIGIMYGNVYYHLDTPLTTWKGGLAFLVIPEQHNPNYIQGQFW